MSPYKKTNKVKDIEHPMATSIHSRDILGVNANIPAMNKTNTDLQDYEADIDYTRKIK